MSRKAAIHIAFSFVLSGRPSACPNLFAMNTAKHNLPSAEPWSKLRDCRMDCMLGVSAKYIGGRAKKRHETSHLAQYLYRQICTYHEMDLLYHLQRISKRWAPGYVKMRWKICVLLSALGKHTSTPPNPSFLNILQYCTSECDTMTFQVSFLEGYTLKRQGWEEGTLFWHIDSFFILYTVIHLLVVDE